MLAVNDDLTTYTLAAGEPFVLEVQLVDADGDTLDIDDNAMVLTFFSQATRAIVTDYANAPAQYQGARLEDDAGEYFRWVLDGRFSEGMTGKGLVMVELAQRLLNGRKVIGTGALVVKASAASVPSLVGGSAADQALRLSVNPATLPGMALVVVRRLIEVSVTPPPMSGYLMDFRNPANTAYVGAFL